MAKKDKPEFKSPWMGLGVLIEGGISAFKWVMILAFLCVMLGLTALGFAVAWWLK